MSTELGGSNGSSNDLMINDSTVLGTLLMAPDRQTLTLRYVADGDVDVRVDGQTYEGYFTYDGVVTVVLQTPIPAGSNASVHYKRTI